MQPCPRHLSDMPTHQRMEAVPPPPTGPDRLMSIHHVHPGSGGQGFDICAVATSIRGSHDEPADSGADEIGSPVADGEVAGWWCAATTLPTVRVRLPEGKPVTEVPMYRVSRTPRRCSSPCPRGKPRRLLTSRITSSTGCPRKQTGRALAAGDSSFPQSCRDFTACVVLRSFGRQRCHSRTAWARARLEAVSMADGLGRAGSGYLPRLLRFACWKGARRSVGYKR
ncbi:hypothetical protein B0T18DRAFT_2477 [Schizothecium vesticola]|uniref:Uncharacterized protein n=1 Tax=Schizothecium vesticola TaxID=314040 RepID=A0AA40KB94_9PEZI|nr:hypothetical protein B0T18DRAFT_2477 [Schizothecium vesticola]